MCSGWDSYILGGAVLGSRVRGDESPPSSHLDCRLKYTFPIPVYRLSVFCINAHRSGGPRYRAKHRSTWMIQQEPTGISCPVGVSPININDRVQEYENLRTKFRTSKLRKSMQNNQNPELFGPFVAFVRAPKLTTVHGDVFVFLDNSSK